MDERLSDFLAAVAAGDDRRTEAAARRLGRLGDAALSGLRPLLTSAEREQRWWAVRALAVVGTPGAAKLLIAALSDPDPDVRACAVVALAELRPPDAVEPLVACLADPSAYVARLAADALAQLGQAAVEPLIRTLQEGEVAARAGAARALRALQPPQAIPALCAALDDPSAVVTAYAEEALERMGVGFVFFAP